MQVSSNPERNDGEQGFLLLALVVVVFLIALFLTVAAPTVARSLERDKEVESEHRAQQYVRAIHNYYLKFGAYPTSLDQLLSQNNQHFLRQQYKDPLTGGDYRLIHAGEAKTEVKGFFGEPLEGFAQGTLGALAGNASGIGFGVGGAGSASAAGTNATGGAAAGSTGSSFGSGGFSLGGSTAGSTGSSSGNSSSTSTDGSTGSSTSATKFQGSKGMIVGVGSTASGHGLVEWNGSSNIEDWEFLYDHRTWLMRQKVSIFGGGPTVANGANSAFGSGINSQSGTQAGSTLGTPAPATGTTPTTGTTTTTPQ